MNNSPQPKSWRDVLPIHPAAELFPLMSQEELRELGENIKIHGLKSHLKVYKGKLLDGRNRIEAMELVGVSINWTDPLGRPFDHLNEQVDPYEYVIAVNLHRRHLTSEQKRELIAKVLKVKPEVSNRKIAKQTKADHKTVAAVRRDLKSTGEIPQLNKTVGANGKARKQPARRKVAVGKSADKPEPSAEDNAEAAKAPSVRHMALQEFNGHVLRLLQITSKAKPERFAKTSVSAADLRQLGHFLAKVGTHRAGINSKAEADKVF